MKKKIHPQYNKNATIHCSCGNVIKVGSTKPEMTVEICSACHPFYTGKEKIVDTAGRVEKFKKRLEKKSSFVNENKQNKKQGNRKDKK